MYCTTFFKTLANQICSGQKKQGREKSIEKSCDNRATLVYVKNAEINNYLNEQKEF